jgi:short-subunit dehydrogenase involved in D-alanine esterification of teichoic acids
MTNSRRADDAAAIKALRKQIASARPATSRRSRRGRRVILAARNPARLEHAAADDGALSTAAFDANDSASLKPFFDGLPDRIDHVPVVPAFLGDR